MSSRRESGERSTDVLLARDEVTVVVGRDELVDALVRLRDQPDLSFGFLSSLTATDHPGREPRFWVVYELRSVEHAHRIRVKVGLPGRRPARPVGHGRSSRRPTGTSARSGTCSVSSSTAIPTSFGSCSPTTGRGIRSARTRSSAVSRRSTTARSSRPSTNGRCPDGDRSGTRVGEEMAHARDGLRSRPEIRDDVTGEVRQETMIINMGPQHPSTHGVLRLLLELDGETVIRCRPIVGYLHTGIEKNTEYRTWVQGVAYVTRADYLSPFFNELAYCLSVERLLGIEAPPRAQILRVLLCELNRIASHLVWVAHRRDGARRRLRDAVRVPGARADPRHLRGRHRASDEPRLHPARRRDHGPARGRRPPDRAVPRRDAGADRRLRTAPERQPDLARAERRRGRPVRGRRARVRRDRAAAPRGRRRRRPPQGRAVQRLRDLRLRRAGADRGRLLRAVPGPHRGDAGVAPDRRAGARAPGGAGPGDGRGPEGRAGR